MIDVYPQMLTTSVKTLVPMKRNFYRNKRYWTVCSSINSAEVIAQLNKVKKAHITDIVSRDADKNESTCDKAKSKCLILKMSYYEEGSVGDKSMSNFTITEFDTIRGQCRNL